MEYQGVIFDFNGTMFFDSDKHALAWKLYARELCGIALSDEAFRAHILGRTNETILRYLLKRELDAQEISQMTRHKEALYRELCLKDPASLKLVDGLPALLDNLRKQGIPHTIATSSEIENLQFYWRQFSLDRWFSPDKIVYDDGNLKGKPDPDVYVKAANVIGVEPRRCIVVEDSPSGVTAAFRAGIGRIMAITEGSDDSFSKDPRIFDVIQDYLSFERWLT